MSLGSITAQNQALAGTYGDNKGATAPASLTFRLFNGDPTSGGAELAGNGYAPVVIANTTTNFGTPAGGSLGPFVVQFPDASGAGWGTPDWWANTDGSGNVYDYGPIPTPPLVPAGSTYLLSVMLDAL